MRLIKICKIESPDLLHFVAFISFYIRYHFSQIFRTSFRIIRKKDFCHKFSLLTDSFKPPHPLNDQNLLSVTKVYHQLMDCQQITFIMLNRPPPPPPNLFLTDNIKMDKIPTSEKYIPFHYFKI